MLIFISNMLRNLTGSYDVCIDPELQKDMDEQTKEQMAESGWSKEEINEFFEKHN